MIQVLEEIYPDDLISPILQNPCLFNQISPRSSLRVSVVVPVRNEAESLTETLDALRNQYHTDGRRLSYEQYEVLVLTNNCTDGSFDVARKYQKKFPEFSLHIANVWLEPAKANIGHVRRLLMDEAYRRLGLTGNSTGIIASTDGDTRVDCHWIEQTIAEIDKGNDAVGGRILSGRHHPANSSIAMIKQSGEEKSSDPARRYHLLDVTYRQLTAWLEAIIDPVAHDPWPRHFQHFAASLAVSCSAYVNAGRLPPAPYLEDEAFYRALLRIDAKVRKSPLVKVFTSTRLQGRVEVGFSWQLQQWADMTQDRKLPMVEGLDSLLGRFNQRNKLRQYWQTMAITDRRTDLMELAAAMKIDPEWLFTETGQSLYFGQLYEKAVQKQAGSSCYQPPRLVTITTAIRELRHFFALTNKQDVSGALK